ncbi:MAG TPA: hypothetical protein VFT00_08645 [Nocardioides sp.]|nr:hypothetical protein [Nocardioides sp.]
MISINNQMAAQIPSGFGMPISGHAFGSTNLRSVNPCAAGTAASARDRKVVTDATTGYFPGTSAWRPPNC